MKNLSCLYIENTKFIEEMYNLYLQHGRSIGEDWYNFFSKNLKEINNEENLIVNYPDKTNNQDSDIAKFFRQYGHFFANLDPLSININQKANYTKYSNLYPNYESRIYTDIYCKNIGFEFMHISSYEERVWLEEKIENQKTYTLNSQNKKEILKNLIESEMFEQFLHIKFPGYKRFSIEGGESTIIAIEEIINSSSILFNIEEIVFGTTHRGRISILTKIMKKKYAEVFAEFQDNFRYPKNLHVSDDVKYHLGYSSNRSLKEGKKIHLSLCYNPSHLEAITPILMGRIKAKQNIKKRVLGLSIHGDASFIGQGIISETLNLTNIEGYKIGGMIHIIINNQIGFTTNPCSARSSFYCTDITKFVEAPVFHVNGDDPESVSFVANLAVKYKQKFKKDVIIDIICYRKYGHNEGDDPNFTQPLMYKAISKHKTPGILYKDKLIMERVLDTNEIDKFCNDFKIKLNQSFHESTTYISKKADWFKGVWLNIKRAESSNLNQYYTNSGISVNELKKLGICINNNIPSNFHINLKIKKIFDKRINSINSGENIDWATAESLAFASLLTEGIEIRLSGQDSGRGTFSHRHSKLIDQLTEEIFIPLNNINEKQAKFEIIDSPLSEYSTMGFEYGYSLDSPYSLVLWEAQFGDFANGAQIIIDQFIASSETKWLRSSGIVLLLPHGYEGQGPEHSSGRIERFLQLCAENNMQIVNCSTPANYFHVLRRQIHRNFRKPLIVFTPKSLLRHKKAVSYLSQFEKNFLVVIPESRIGLISNDKIRKTIICSGKIYYDIIEKCESQKVNDISIIRLEQLYPFPADKLSNEIKKYKNAEIIWCQEEPKNMGGWTFINPLIEKILLNINIHKIKKPKCISRPASASPACGSLSLHTEQQEEILKQVIS